jgi:hypothetical protein
VTARTAAANREAALHAERYPDHLGRTVLWAGAITIYGMRDQPDADLGQMLLAGIL